MFFTAPLAISRRLGLRALSAAVSAQTPKEQLVILGCGWGGYRMIRDVLKTKYDVTVVAPRNHMLFTPLLASTTVGTLEFRSITEPVRSAVPTIKEFYLAECTSIDPKTNTVVCRGAVDKHEFTLKYDKLVVSIGAQANTFGIKGVKENAFFLKELSDAQNIRNRLLQNAARAGLPTTTEEEKRKLLHFVIVGGGPTGVEFAGELHDFLEQDFARLFKNLNQYVSVTLLEANEILSSFDKHLREYAENRMQMQHVTVRKESVKEVTPEHIRLSCGEELPYGLIVWSTGVGARDVVGDYGLELGRAKRIVTDNHLLATGHKNIYAIGDCAMMEGRDPFPPIAQVAEKQGKYLGEVLNAMKKGDDPSAVPPFTYMHFGMMAYLGEYKALLQVNVPAEKSANMRGWSSWFAWRSTYLTKLGMFKNRLQVPIDWLKTLLVGRDITLPDTTDPFRKF